MFHLAAFHRRLVCQRAVGFFERLLLLFLTPAGWFLGLIGFVRVLFFRWGLFPSYRANVPVISVGNLAVGGTGKTPIVDHVVKYFLSLGKRVAVVSRGYGGRKGRGVKVASAGAGPILPPEICGDEPYLLALRNPQALVFVASRRAQGVRLAEKRFCAEVIVLDDGFQHLAVRRDLDIVLLDALHPLGNGKVLPAGLLREFPSALQRGDLFLLTRSEVEAPQNIVLPGPVLHCRHVLADVAVSLTEDELPLTALVGKKGVAFAGIGDPECFFTDLAAHGLTLEDTLSFPDHAVYKPAEIERIANATQGTDYLVTTEKDGVKLKGKSFAVPCYQVPLTLKFFEEGEFEKTLQTFV
jgi:tetraacyldisaccharide 4'-kinase